MAQRVVLHVGAMKSGTSYIQDRLVANQAALEEQGILFPGRAWRDQVHAVKDVLGDHHTGDFTGKWDWLVRTAADWPGTVVVSMEFLAAARPAKVREIVDSFGDTPVEVVLTVRDLNRNIPAMWQETVQNYKTWSWDQHLREARRGPGPKLKRGPGHNFWRQQNTPAMAKAWSGVVGRDRFTLVTLPPPGAEPEVLWQRFCSVVGIDAEACASIPRSNEALGAASSLVMQRLNVILQERGLEWCDYSPMVKWGLAKAGLAKRKSQEPAIGFAVPRWVARRTRKMVKELRRLDVPVVGDLAELEPVPVRGTDPRKVSEGEQLEAALAGMADLVELWRVDREALRKKKQAG